MPRLRELSCTLLLCACNAPAHDHPTSSSTTETSETSSSTTSTETTSVMTTTEDSGSGGTSHSSTTSSTSSTTTTGHDPVCGDGMIEGDEECDDANDIEDDRCRQCTINRWVFASAAFHDTGDFGGVAGADNLCRQYALQSGRAADTWKNFVAWLSDADHDVRDRLPAGRGRYVRTDGVVIADSFDQFLSPTHLAPIDIDEHGQPAPGGVVTGTHPDGTAAPGMHCENWTSGSLGDFSAYYGNSGATDEAWTLHPNPDLNPTSCSPNARLYCIEGA